MSTPYMLMAGWFRGVFVAFWTIWLATMVVTRTYAFHEAYIIESQRVEDERYLLARCSDPEFYSNIRQHTGICAEVLANSRANILLKALNVVAQGTHMCGARPCSEAVRLLIARLTWQAVGLIAIALLVFPNAAHALFRSMGILAAVRTRRAGKGKYWLYAPSGWGRRGCCMPDAGKGFENAPFYENIGGRGADYDDDDGASVTSSTGSDTDYGGGIPAAVQSTMLLASGGRGGLGSLLTRRRQQQPSQFAVVAPSAPSGRSV